MTVRTAIIVDSVPSYRRNFYERLLDNSDIQLTVFCQSHLRGFNLKLIHKELGKNFVEIPFFSAASHLATWQRLPIKRLWREFDVYFFVGNPRIISTVLWATLFRALGKKVVIWGQAHTAGANPRNEALRLGWWKLFRNHLVYTDTEVEYLRARGFEDRFVLGMNNGLDQDQIEGVKKRWTPGKLRNWRTENGLLNKELLLSCARLVTKNRFEQVLEVLPQLIETRRNLVWCVIGSGDQQDDLKRKASELGIANHIIWVGEVYREDELAPWFLSATMLIHPGAIGLSLMHAFGYGLPVVTHDNLNYQMPEIAAFENDVNGCAFRENDSDSLRIIIGKLLDDSVRLENLGQAALETVTSGFNTRTMAERFVTIARRAVGDQ